MKINVTVIKYRQRRMMVLLTQGRFLVGRRLARALIDLKGLCITNKQTKVIQEFYQDLLDFNKRPLVFKPSVTVTLPRGCFGCCKGGGHISVDNMKWYVYVNY